MTRSAAWQVLLIFGLICLQAEWSTPHDNEAHYLTKARHYWNPTWCADDMFLQSADAHLVFYWTLGWLTLWLPLPVLAWIGRFASWLLIAYGLQRIGRNVFGPSTWYIVAAAGLFLLLLNRFDLAGEWIIGGFEAKLIAYGFAFLAISSLLENRWRIVFIWLGLASMFHVLVGGWMLLAVAMAWLLTRRKPTIVQLLPYAVVALVLSLAGLIPALTLGGGVPAEQKVLAYGIYTYQRLPHHLVFSRIWDVNSAKVLWHGALVLVWVFLQFVAWRDVLQRQISKLVIAAIAFALVGITIDTLAEWESNRQQSAASSSFFSDLAFHTLRFYWFRLSDVMVPLGTSFALLGWSHRTKGPRFLQVVTVAIVLIAVANHVVEIRVQRLRDPRPASCRRMIRVAEPRELLLHHFREWKAVCRWIRRETPSDSVWLTPRLQQTFKWYAGRAEVVNWKDTPQDAKTLLQWHQRISDVFKPDDQWYYGLSTHTSDQLLAVAKKYDAQFVLVDRDNFYQYRREVKNAKLVERFRNEFYTVYEVK